MDSPTRFKMCKALTNGLIEKKHISTTALNTMLSQMEENPDFNYGWNARTLSFGNLVDEGILDATKVVRCALENGASVAGSLLTVEGLVVDDIEANAKIMAMYQRTPQMGM